LGQSHFVKTVEDLYEVMVSGVPKAQFGIAFCEASGDRLIRRTGTNEELETEAVRMAEVVGAGHSFVIVMQDMYPINVLPQIKQVQEVVSVFCATANPVQVIVAVSEQGRGVIGVIDGGSPTGIETTQDQMVRHDFLRKIGYKQ